MISPCAKGKYCVLGCLKPDNMGQCCKNCVISCEDRCKHSKGKKDENG
jgi:hypothetical protein